MRYEQGHCQEYLHPSQKQTSDKRANASTIHKHGSMCCCLLKSHDAVLYSTQAAF